MSLHTQGFLRALAKPVILHLLQCVRDPAYRAFHRFSLSLRRRESIQISELRFAGRPIKLLDGPSFLSAWDEIFVNRIYDIGECRGTPRLVDVGANIGLAALYWSYRYKDYRYVGFEPDAEIASICDANLKSWNCQGKVIRSAVTGSARGREAYFVSDRADGGRVVDSPTSCTSVVPTTCLSDYLGERTDLLKIDAEGAEAEIVEEASHMLPNVRNIFVEIHSSPRREQNISKITSILQQAGYRLYLQSLFGPTRPFLDTPRELSGYDMLVNVFGVLNKRE